MPHQNLILFIISIFYLKHVITVKTRYWLLLILYKFREENFFSTNEILQTRIFVMDGCKIRMSDKIHLKT